MDSRCCTAAHAWAQQHLLASSSNGSSGGGGGSTSTLVCTRVSAPPGSVWCELQLHSQMLCCAAVEALQKARGAGATPDTTVIGGNSSALAGDDDDDDDDSDDRVPEGDPRVERFYSLEEVSRLLCKCDANATVAAAASANDTNATDDLYVAYTGRLATSGGGAWGAASELVAGSPQSDATGHIPAADERLANGTLCAANDEEVPTPRPALPAHTRCLHPHSMHLQLGATAFP